MEGPAVQVLLDLAPVDRTSLEGLITSLERHMHQHQSANESREHLASCYRQDGERLDDLAADVWLHTQRSYSRFSPADQEDLALHAFLCALSWYFPSLPPWRSPQYTVYTVFRPI